MARKRASQKRHEFVSEQPGALVERAPAVEGLEVLERGCLYFVYRPAVAEGTPHGVTDIRRFYLALRPNGSDRLRWLVIGHKKLPEPSLGDQRYWGFVDGVGDARAAGQALAGTRPAGDGAYALVRHHGHTHLAYTLALPEKPGPVQHDLAIQPEASYLLVVKNPKASTPPGMGLDAERKVELPDELQARFGDRRFLPLDTPAFLDQPGCELLLIGTAEDLEAELGFHVDTSELACQPRAVLDTLGLAPGDTPTAPLIEGEWA